MPWTLTHHSLKSAPGEICCVHRAETRSGHPGSARSPEVTGGPHAAAGLLRRHGNRTGRDDPGPRTRWTTRRCARPPGTPVGRRHAGPAWTAAAGDGSAAVDAARGRPPATKPPAGV